MTGNSLRLTGKKMLVFWLVNLAGKYWHLVLVVKLMALTIYAKAGAFKGQ